MTPSEQAAAKACCADLYQSDLARMLFGDTLHPGGLGLTNQMTRLMGIQSGDLVLDLASGHGASALAVSRVCRCTVVGVEFGAQAAAEARRRSQLEPGGHLASFVQGDAEALPVRTSSFDAAICECSISLFTDKPATLAEVARVLRPGGRFGASDVTVTPGALPEELGGTVGELLCLADALDAEGYIDLLQSAGLVVTHAEDASQNILKIVDDVEAKLGFLSAWPAATSQVTTTNSVLDQAPRLMAMVRGLVNSGNLGYWVFVAEKPGR